MKSSTTSKAAKARPVADAIGNTGSGVDSGGTSATAGEPVSATPSREEQIRNAAYEAYLQRGDRAGNEVDDWLAAERAVDESIERGPMP